MSAIRSNLGLHGERPGSSWSVSFLRPQGTGSKGMNCRELNSNSTIVIIYPRIALMKLIKWSCVTRFKMLFSLQTWCYCWCFNIFYTSSDWRSLFILKHSHAEKCMPESVLQCPSLLKTILLSSISWCIQFLKHKQTYTCRSLKAAHITCFWWRL